MSAIFHFIMAWKDLITEVFGKYPLAGALITLLAIGVFFQLQKTWRKGSTATNLLLTLIAWAVAVPILGFVLNVLAAAWEFIEGAAPIAAKILGSTYVIYSHHPYMVLGIVVVAALTYFAWKRWRPKLLPSRAARVIAVIVAAIVVTHILAPIADNLAPAREANAAAEKRPDQTNTTPKPASTPAVSPNPSPAR